MVQVRTTTRSVICHSNLSTVENIVRGVIMIPCVVFLRDHLTSARRISLIIICRGRVYGLGGEHFLEYEHLLDTKDVVG